MKFRWSGTFGFKTQKTTYVCLYVIGGDNHVNDVLGMTNGKSSQLLMYPMLSYVFMEKLINLPSEFIEDKYRDIF